MNFGTLHFLNCYTVHYNNKQFVKERLEKKNVNLLQNIEI